MVTGLHRAHRVTLSLAALTCLALACLVMAGCNDSGSSAASTSGTSTPASPTTPPVTTPPVTTPPVTTPPVTTPPVTPPPTVSMPAAPTGVAATAGSAQVSLAWSVEASATGYHVKRATVSGGPYTAVASPTTGAYMDAGLTNGTTYYYIVTAVNTAGESPASAQASAKPQAPPAPAQIPSVPGGLAATSGSAQVGLAWTSVSGATSYHVKRATVTGGPYTTVGSPTMAAYSDAGLTNGTKYYYVVSALDSAGESANSAPATGSPVAPTQTQIPAVPAGLTAAPGNTQATLGWGTVSAATSYHVKRATTSGGPYTQVAAPTTNAFTDTALTNGTTYYYVVSAVNSAGESANTAQASVLPAAPAQGVNVTITIDPTKTHKISAYIYGINSYGGTPSDLTFDREGGNRTTAYNWETNASNAGSDYLYQNDNFFTASTTPGEAWRTFIAGDQAKGIPSLMTFQMQGLVAGDESGPVSTANPPDLSRFKVAYPKKSAISAAPFTLTPPTNDNAVYMDEFMWALDQKFSGQNIFGTSALTQRVFAELDNEPELWNSTHLEIQGSHVVTTDAYIAKTIAMAQALKAQFPGVLIFGPVHYGFGGIYNWQGELNATPSGNNWFPDKYLPAIKTASMAFGAPLIDVYDFHWYSEATDSSGDRVTNLNGASLTDDQVQAIVQSPRSLWDSTYQENSWITQSLGGPIYILGRLQSRIASENTGMQIAITEYNNGGGAHIAGTIAEADNLGIFGAQNVFAANYWSLGSDAYILAGFKAFRDFDGAHASFGDTALQAVSSNVANVAVYASTDTQKAGRTVFVAINRTKTAQVTAINGQPLSGTAHLFQMTATTAQGQSAPAPVAAGTQSVSGSSLTVTLPPLSVTTIDIY